MSSETISYDECIDVLNSLSLIRNITDDTDEEPSFLFTKNQINLAKSIIDTLNVTYPIVYIGPSKSIAFQFIDEQIGILTFLIYQDLSIWSKMDYVDNTSMRQMVSYDHMLHMIGAFVND